MGFNGVFVIGINSLNASSLLLSRVECIPEKMQDQHNIEL